MYKLLLNTQTNKNQKGRRTIVYDSCVCIGANPEENLTSSCSFEVNCLQNYFFIYVRFSTSRF